MCLRRITLLVVATFVAGCNSQLAGSPIIKNESHASVATPRQSTQNVSVIHTFSGEVLTSCSATGATLDGAYPTSALTADGNGDVLGTTETGGSCGAGTVYELTSNGTSGVWNYRQIYAFTGGSDGGGSASGLIFDANGNAFGTAASGGAYGRGVVYEVIPPSDSQSRWTEHVLYSFKGLPDGAGPLGDLVMRNGKLFGTTARGGHSHIGCLQGCGTIFELTPGGTGWHETVLHEFLDALGEGANPYAGLTVGGDGEFFGTTYYGGNDLGCSGLGCGTVFELLQGRGSWRLRVLRAFRPQDGAFPNGPVLLDGNYLYGTTGQGGTFNDGTLFRFVRDGNHWLPNGRFNFDNTNGNDPTGALTLQGNTLYGTTFSGGSNLWGTVYSVQTGAKNLHEQVIYNFTDGSDGSTPFGSNVLLLGGGSFLTAAGQGGMVSACSGGGCGTVVAGFTGSRMP